MVITLAAVALLVFKLAADRLAAILCVTTLILSKTFIDYATSGLENTLGYLIVVWFSILFLRNEAERFEVPHIRMLALVAALGMLCRMDYALLFAPALVRVLWHNRSWRTVCALAVGFLPFVSWELFSLLYYGFPFPNTAYAKLGAGIPSVEYLKQGGWYFYHSFFQDPIALLTISVSIVFSLIWGTRRQILLGVGIALYLLYVAKVGGDFMIGRFFAVPLVLAACMVTQFPIRQLGWSALILAGSVLVIGIFTGESPIYDGSDFARDDHVGFEMGQWHGVVDERAAYYQSFGLIPLLSNKAISFPPLKERARKGIIEFGAGDTTATVGTIGYYGLIQPDNVYLIDIMALSDPLLARLRMSPTPTWRIGHLKRDLPCGYMESRETGENRICDSNLAEYFDRLKLITEGPLFSCDRMKEIVRFNTGGNNQLMYAYYHPPQLHVRLADMYEAAHSIDTWSKSDIREVPFSGMVVDLDSAYHSDTLSIFLGNLDQYTVRFYNHEELVGEILTPITIATFPEVVWPHDLSVPNEATVSGFDQIAIIPKYGNERYEGGHIRLSR